MSKNSGKGLGRIANHKSNLNARIVSSFKLVPNKPKRPCQISGDWDKDKLALLITDLQGAGFDVSLTGFDLGEIDDLFKDTLKDGIHDDDFDVDAELKKPAISKQGDVWTLGRHEIVCGNSTDTAVFKKLLGNAK